MIEAPDVDFIKDIATDIARAETKAALKTIVFLHARLANDLIAKNVLTREEYIDSLDKIAEDSASTHENDPELFDAIARAAITVFQQPLPTSEQQGG